MIKVKSLFFFLLSFIAVSFNANMVFAWSSWDDFDSPKWIKVDKNSSTGKAIKQSGDFMQWVPLIMAGALVIYHQDNNFLKIRWKEHFKEDFFNYERYKNDGLSQLILSYGLSLGAYAIINRALQRPRPRDMMNENKSHHWFNGGRSFPSGHSTNAYAPAFFIAWRYGWLTAMPALLAAAYTGWVRISVDAHYISDVAVAAGMSAIISWIFTHPYKVGKAQVQVSGANGIGAGVNIQW